MKSRLIDILFISIYKLYDKWGELDLFFTSVFVLGALVVSTLNFILACIFYFTLWETLDFKLVPNAVILGLFLILFIWWMYSRKEHFLKIASNPPSYYKRNRILSYIILVFMFSTWFLAPMFYKWGYEAM